MMKIQDTCSCVNISSSASRDNILSYFYFSSLVHLSLKSFFCIAKLSNWWARGPCPTSCSNAAIRSSWIVLLCRSWISKYKVTFSFFLTYMDAFNCMVFIISYAKCITPTECSNLECIADGNTLYKNVFCLTSLNLWNKGWSIIFFQV